MSLEFSAVVSARKKVHSDAYSSHHLAERYFDGLVDPLYSLDHFRMSEKTFGARPQAGFSAVTYLFEDSPGGLLNRDSLGDRSEILPGALHWTLAGKGIVHEESPLHPGREARGIQLFVNLSSEGKRLSPRAYHLAPAQVPEWKPSTAVRGRILVGKQGGVASPVELPEPFTLFELHLNHRSSYSPRILADSGALLYMVAGRVRVSSEESVTTVEPLQALGMRSTERPGEIIVEALEDAHFLFLSGRSLREPIVAHGSFVMNSRAQISEAIEAFQRGEMGRID